MHRLLTKYGHRFAEAAADGDVQVAVRPKREPFRTDAERCVGKVERWRCAGDVEIACMKVPQTMLHT